MRACQIQSEGAWWLRASLRTARSSRSSCGPLALTCLGITLLLPLRNSSTSYCSPFEECNIRRLSCPTLDDHLGMKLPIGWRVMALGQFTDLAFFLLVLRCSCLHMFGHGSIPFSVTFSSPMVSPLRNAAVLLRSSLGLKKRIWLVETYVLALSF